MQKDTSKAVPATAKSKKKKVSKYDEVFTFPDGFMGAIGALGKNRANNLAKKKK